jgi:hypothetical protein
MLLQDNKVRQRFRRGLRVTQVSSLDGNQIKVTALAEGTVKERLARPVLVRIHFKKDVMEIQATSFLAELGYHAFVEGNFMKSEGGIVRCWALEIPADTCLLMGLQGPEDFLYRLVFALSEAEWHERWLPLVPGFLRGAQIPLGPAISFLSAPETLSLLKKVRPELRYALGALLCSYGIDEGARLALSAGKETIEHFGMRFIHDYSGPALATLKADPFFVVEQDVTPEDYRALAKQLGGSSFKERLSASLVRAKAEKVSLDRYFDWTGMLALGAAQGTEGAAEEFWTYTERCVAESGKESAKVQVRLDRLLFMYHCREALDETFLREKGFFPYIKQTGCPRELCSFLLQQLETETENLLVTYFLRQAALCGMPELCHLSFLEPWDRAQRIAELRKWLASQELVE